MSISAVRKSEQLPRLLSWSLNFKNKIANLRVLINEAASIINLIMNHHVEILLS